MSFQESVPSASLALVGFGYLQHMFWRLSYPGKTYAGPPRQAVQAQATMPMKTANAHQTLANHGP